MKTRFLEWRCWALTLCLGMAVASRGETIASTNAPPLDGSCLGDALGRFANDSRSYECDLGFTNCFVSIDDDFYVVATNTLAMMERIVAAQCLAKEAEGVRSLRYPSNRLQINDTWGLDRDEWRRQIRRVLLCDDDEVADEMDKLRLCMHSAELSATLLTEFNADFFPIQETEAPIDGQNDNVETNGLLESDLGKRFVDFNFDNWDVSTSETNAVDSQIAYSTKKDPIEIPTEKFGDPNLKLIYVLLRSHYMSVMYEEFCSALLTRLQEQKGGGEGQTTSENSK